MEIKRKRIKEFKKGNTLFRSTGISYVKVSSLVEGDGGEMIPVVECLEIPIQSTGVSELIDTFQEKAPNPPVSNELIDPDSEIGKQLGISKKQWVKIPNYTDAAYIKARDEHNRNLTMAILMKGMAVEVKDENGQPIIDRDKAVAVLREMGLSADQFSQIVSDITSLTKWTEKEMSDFFGAKQG